MTDPQDMTATDAEIRHSTRHDKAVARALNAENRDRDALPFGTPTDRTTT